MYDYNYWIGLALENFGLSMLLLAIILTLIEWPIQKIMRRSAGCVIFYRWLALLAVGVTAVYAFIMHAFFPEFTAKTIGWVNSQFQFEVAIANLAIAVIAILSFKASVGFRLATVIATTVWLWGDGGYHLYNMVTQNNFTVGNAGSWLWIDIVVPILLIICVVKIKRREESMLPVVTTTVTDDTTPLL